MKREKKQRHMPLRKKWGQQCTTALSFGRGEGGKELKEAYQGNKSGQVRSLPK